MAQSKILKICSFYCPDCNIEFKIEVEPRYSSEELKKEFPESLGWLLQLTNCPVCDRGLVRR